MTTLDTEVLVIGGGPAGAACALALSRLRRSVILCEEVSFPRDHIGICLSPGLFKQLEFLGVRHVLEHPAHRHGLTVERRWGSIDSALAPSEVLVADRGRFDSDMLAAVASSPARVLQPARVAKLTRFAGGCVADVATAAGMRQVRAAFVVDARGRSSGHRARRRLGAPTVAVHGAWRGEVRPTVLMSSNGSSWAWAAPTGTRRSLAVVFTSPDALHRLKGSLEKRYLRLVEESDILEPGLELVSPPRACEATPYLTEGGETGLLRIGDADAALDPLSSSGVQAAVQSALCAGPVINTLLTSSADHSAANDYWSSRRIARSKTHKSWAAERYAEAFCFHGTEFWKDRAAAASAAKPSAVSPTPLPFPDQLLMLSDRVTFIEAPCLVDDLVVRERCLFHPNLDEPIAFVGGLALRPMIKAFAGKTTAAQVVTLWSSFYTPEKAVELLRWFWRHQIAVAC
ncbi:flavin-dependent dehydrogenase [Bradyrhizobium sp. F1.13.1]